MTIGDARYGSGRETSFGRRLRVGAAGTIAIGGALFAGGAATLVTAFAHSGVVTTSQSCSTWTASAVTNADVTLDRTIVVTTTIPGTTGVGSRSPLSGVHVSGVHTIFSATGASPSSGTVQMFIYDNNNNLEWGPPGSGAATTSPDATSTLVAPSNCTSAIKTIPSAGGVVGTSIHDAATVTGTTGSPSGTVVFALFPPTDSNCTGSALYTSPAVALTSVSPGVSTATSPSVATAAVGIFHWVATYSGSSVYKGVASVCADEAATISSGAPTISTTPTAGGTVPRDVQDTATVSGGVNPTGTVTFVLYPTVADCNAATNAVAGSTATVALSGGQATSPKVTLTAAGPDYAWQATYNGDANNAKAVSRCTDEVFAITTTPTPTPTPTPSGIGGINIPNTGGTGSLTGVTIGGFLLLGGLGVALMGSILPRRRRRSAP